MSEKDIESLEEQFLLFATNVFGRCMGKLIERSKRSGLHIMEPADAFAHMKTKYGRCQNAEKWIDFEDDSLDMINYALIYKFLATKQFWTKTTYGGPDGPVTKIIKEREL